MNALQFEALKIALKQDSTGYVLTVKVHPDEIPEELLRDFVGARYMVAMVRVSDDESPTSYKNRVQKAGMLCRDKEFQGWLQQVHGLNAMSESAAAKFIYKSCGIESRTELNGNSKAQILFDELVKEFDTWRTSNVPF
jgi:hypothetical protein